MPLPLVKAEEVVEPWYLEDGVVLPGILGVVSFQQAASHSGA